MQTNMSCHSAINCQEKNNSFVILLHQTYAFATGRTRALQSIRETAVLISNWYCNLPESAFLGTAKIYTIWWGSTIHRIMRVTGMRSWNLELSTLLIEIQKKLLWTNTVFVAAQGHPRKRNWHLDRTSNVLVTSSTHHREGRTVLTAEGNIQPLYVKNTFHWVKNLSAKRAELLWVTIWISAF